MINSNEDKLPYFLLALIVVARVIQSKKWHLSDPITNLLIQKIWLNIYPRPCYLHLQPISPTYVITLARTLRIISRFPFPWQTCDQLKIRQFPPVFCVQIRQLSPIMFIANGKLDKTRSFYVASAWTQTGTRRVQISKHFLLWFWHISKWSLVWDFSLLAREVMRIILRIPNCSINNDQNESMISPGLTFTSEGWLQVILRVSPRTKCFAGN